MTPSSKGWVFEVVFCGRNVNSTAFRPIFVCNGEWYIMKATLQSPLTNLLSNSFTDIGGFSPVALAADIPVILTLLCLPLEHFFPFLSHLTFNVFLLCPGLCLLLQLPFAETMTQQTDCKTAGPYIVIRHLHNTKFELERFFLQETNKLVELGKVRITEVFL